MTKILPVKSCRSIKTQGEIERALRHAGGRRYASGNRSRRICLCTRCKRKEDPTMRIVGYRGRFEGDTNRNMENNGIRQRRHDRLKDTAVCGKQGGSKGPR